MTLESQLVSLPLAKRLKDLGVKQEGLYYWYSSGQTGSGKPLEPYKIQSAMIGVESYVKMGTAWAAFTVAELGEMLPVDIDYVKRNGVEGIKWISSSEDNDVIPTIAIIESTEADARAKMLIYLIENGLVKP